MTRGEGRRGSQRVGEWGIRRIMADDAMERKTRMRTVRRVEGKAEARSRGRNMVTRKRERGMRELREEAPRLQDPRYRFE